MNWLSIEFPKTLFYVARKSRLHAPGLAEHGRTLDATGDFFRQIKADKQ